MILQALYDYYQRKAADPESKIAPEGFQWQEIPFVVVIDRDGHFVRLEDTREGEGRARRAKRFLVPAAEKKSVNIKSNLLWGSVEYALGANPRGRSDIQARKADFLRRVSSDVAEHPVREALLRFLGSNPLAQVEDACGQSMTWKEALDTNANVVFRIEGENSDSVCESLAEHILRFESNGREGVCLVSGRKISSSRIHPSIKGVRDAQSSGAALVSFNLPAFCSFGKEQNYNASVSASAVFAYTTALNSLLGKDSSNKVQVGDATTVFWSERKTSFEEDFPFFWSPSSKDDPDRGIRVVEALFKSPFTGATLPEDSIRFHVLGLAPNSARIAVRYWHTGTIAEISDKIRQHFLDLKIVESKGDRGSYALFFLLSDIAVEGKADNIPPNLAGEVMRAILTGCPYPASLLQQAVRRFRIRHNGMRSEQSARRSQVAVLKAYINRQNRLCTNSPEKEITMALDSTNTNPGYRLGRLFAALEKIQEDAQPGINTTIRDRFYGAASSSPVSVFPQLLKLKNHHLAKLENRAFRVKHEKRLSEIFEGMPPSMPAHLSMEDQARFAVGYYHQRQAFFTKSEKSE